MKRGKRFLEDDNTFIYAGAIVFVLLAIALGIIMYMTAKSGIKTEETEKISQDIQENTETVTNEMGKTVEEQEKKEQEEIVKKDSQVPVNNTETKTEVNKTTQTNNKKSINVEKEIKTNTSETKEQPKEVKKEITFVKPTEGEIICEYAKDNLVYSETLKEWITHTAIDVKADKTSVIKAAADGIVKSIINDPRYGLTIVIGHDDGYETVYSNLLTAEFVVEGEEVKQGQTIGTVGNTAAFESSMEYHLHFELLKDGEYLDPTIYLK